MYIEGSLTLIAPYLLVYEVANALSCHPDLSVDEIKEDLEALLMLDLDLIQPSGEFVSSIAETARKYSGIRVRFKLPPPRRGLYLERLKEFLGYVNRSLFRSIH